MVRRTAFIGTGNMGGALVRAACRAMDPGQVGAANRTAEKTETLSAETGCRAFFDNREAAAWADVVFLGVKPYQLKDVVAEIAPDLGGKLLVSMAAGPTIAEIESWAGNDVRVLRIMPNTPCAIGKGMTALCGGKTARESDYAAVEEILERSGQVERLDEHLIDAFSAVAGCGPAYAYQFIEALSDGGVAAGLPREKAIRFAAQMLVGAGSMILETKKHPGELKDAVCSPGGSTIQGVAELERGGMRAAVINAVLAAWEKNGKLGK